jgi:hypothetical protein
VFEKFADYVPRQEPNSWLAGGKRMLLHPHRMDRDARMKRGPLRAGRLDKAVLAMRSMHRSASS